MDRESLELMRTTAKAVLVVLEQQAAGYTSLTIPAPLQVQLQQKREEVASLEARLAQLDGRKDVIPNNLLARAPIFVGREAEIERCLEALDPDDRGWGVSIDGLGGMGKTALAVEVAHEALRRAYFDAYLFASAKTTWLAPEGVREETLAVSSLDAFVREFARLIAHPGVEGITDAAARRRALLDALRGRRALLILDNLETLTAEEREMIAEFLRKLPSPNKAIVTSRRRTGEGALTIRLDRLSEAEAFQLMKEFGQRQARVTKELAESSEIMCRELYELTGGNPLALHWTLGLVAAKGISLAVAAQRLRDAAQSTDLHKFLFADAVEELTATDRRVLSALAAFLTPTSADILAIATEIPKPQVDVALERLLMLSLVNDLHGETYGLHPLTRSFVHAALKQDRSKRRGRSKDVKLDSSAHRKVLFYWVDYAKRYGGGQKDSYQTFDRLENEWPNLEGVSISLRDLAGTPELLRDETAARGLVELGCALREFLDFRGYWEEGFRLSEWSYEAAIFLGAWRDAGWLANGLAFRHFHRNETELSRHWTLRMADAYERSGEPIQRAMVLRLQGILARKQGDFEEAERLSSEALARVQSLGDKRAEAFLLSDLGTLAACQAQHDKAERFLIQALLIFEKESEKRGQASIFGKLGMHAMAAGQLEKARGWYTKELEMARELGNQLHLAHALQGGASVLEALNCPEDALPLAQEALKIQEKLRSADLNKTQQLVSRLRETINKRAII